MPALLFRFLPYIILAIGALSFIGAVYWKGHSTGSQQEQIRALKGTLKQEQKYEKIKQEVIRLPRDDLRARYCEWVRDDKQLCLQADIPISPR